MKSNFYIIKIFVIVLTANLVHLNLHAQVSVSCQRNNLKRTGWNNRETVLNKSTVTPQTFGKVFSRTVDDQVYAQPLVISNVPIGGGVHNVLIVATVNNSIYAFDADDASKTTPYWQVNLTPAGSRPVKNLDMTGSCGGNYKDFSGNIGIVGTPAVDTTNYILYAVARSVKTSGNYNFQQFFHALDLRTGASKPNSPVYIDASVNGNGDGSINGVITFDHQKNNQRTALMLYNNVVYICWASHCDWGPYHGWILGYDATTLSQKYVYNTTPEGGNGGVWMSGQGPSVDDDGNFYISIGNGTVGFNGDPNDITNRGESLLKMTPDLKVLDFFTPEDYQYLEDYDLDYGADGVLLVPNTNISLSGSKEAYLYVVDNTNMGKLSAADANIIQKININADNPNPMRHIHGAPVYYKNELGKEYIYVWAENGWFKQIPFDRANSRFDENNQILSKLILPDGMPGGFMSISSDASKANTGIVWVATPFSGNANQAVVPGILRAFDANDITKELWNSNMNAGDSIGKFAKFVCPTIANGKVYMATFSKTINVYSTSSSITLRTPENPANAVNGVHYKYYEGEWDYIPNYNTMSPVKVGDTANYGLDTRLQDDDFGYDFTGFINVPTDGYYTFYIGSDDGSRLYIGNSMVVENDGLHGYQENYGVIGLKAGKHAITVKYFERGADNTLTVRWSGPGIAKQDIPNASLYYVPFTCTTYPTAVLTNVESGINFSFYLGNWNAVPDFSTLVPYITGTNTNISIGGTPGTNQDLFGLLYTGYVYAPTDGAYKFYLSSDDGSKLYIGNTLVINNDGLHGQGDKIGQTCLSKGLHPIRVEFFESGGGEFLEVNWEGPGFRKKVIGDTSLFKDASISGITDPASNFNISFKPNPSSQNIVLQLSGFNSAIVKVKNLQGETVVSEKEMRNGDIIEIGTLPQGIYLVVIDSGKDIVTKKLVKN